VEMFRAALNADPAVHVIRINLSMALVRCGRHAEAIPILRKCIELEPDDAALYGLLGYSLNAVGNKDEAWEEFQHAVKVDPAIFANWQNVRVQLLQQGRGDEARTLWRAALAAVPPKHALWDGYAEFCLYLGREDEYRWARRELLARFGETLDPHVAERTGRACLLLPATEDELRKASALIDRALAADRSKLEFSLAPYFFRFAQGLLAYRQRRFAESSAIMKGDAASVLGPAPGLVLAMDQFQLGKHDDARKTLQIALKAFDWQPAKADSREAWMYHILRREAEGLIKAGSPSKP
jgi:eukaryotic-like serine/threonine-protein kinase